MSAKPPKCDEHERRLTCTICDAHTETVVDHLDTLVNAYGNLADAVMGSWPSWSAKLREAGAKYHAMTQALRPIDGLIERHQADAQVPPYEKKP